MVRIHRSVAGFMVIERQRRGQDFSRHDPRRASIRLLAAGAALTVRALGTGRAGALAALSADSLGGCGRSESESGDDGEQGARFDQCLHGVLSFVTGGNHSRPERDSPPGTKSPQLFSRT